MVIQRKNSIEQNTISGFIIILLFYTRTKPFQINKSNISYPLMDLHIIVSSLCNATLELYSLVG